MHNFSCTLVDKANDWFYDDLVGPITSFADILKLFIKHWEPHIENEDIEMFIGHVT
jgi:hypothetical protein